jgi:hypothetical protein
MPSWEYALLSWSTEEMKVGFTHHESWRKLDREEFWDVLRRLGDEGWEMLSVLEEPVRERSLYWLKRPRP